MRIFQLLLGSFILLSVISCNDGDVIDFEFDFEDTFNSCGTTDLLVFKTREDPSETISVAISNFTVEDIFDTDSTLVSAQITQNGTFTYRTYDRSDLPNDLFCNNIPPANLNIVVDQSSPVTANFFRTLVEDDNDGVPANLEGQDPNGDGDFSDAIDTDGDGLPDYIDDDDDGDNVPTALENPDPNGNGIIIDDDAQDTDGDGTPDYLDPDDDGDGVLTRDEESVEQNQNPFNDSTDSSEGPDFLNPEKNNVFPATAFREHTIQQTYTVRLVVEGINIGFISQDVFDFGNLTGASQLSGRRTVTPEFN